MLKSIGGPGSLGLLVLCLVAGLGVMAARPRARRGARRFLAGVIGVYAILSLPCTSSALMHLLPAAPVPKAPPGQIDTLVIFGGDNTAGRVAETARVMAEADPRTIWVLDSPGMMDRLGDAGLPLNRMRLYVRVSNTRDQIEELQHIASSPTAGHVAVIGSSLQAPRIAALAAAAGLAVTIIPAPLDVPLPAGGVRRFVPSYPALRTSRDVIYELAATMYYRWKGWIGPVNE